MKSIIIAVAAAVGVAFSSVAYADTKELTLVSYAVAKPVYAKIIPAFKKKYKADTGTDVTFKESYGASGAQNRAIIGGLEADVLATNVQAYVDQLVTAGLVKDDWAKRVPHEGIPATSIITAFVRPGNPKNIQTWDDLTKDGIGIVAINPKTSGNARWGVLAGYVATLKTKDEAAAKDYVFKLVKNTKTLVAGGREATDAFVKNQLGDALLTFENEAKFADKVAGTRMDYVAPKPNIRVDFPVAVIDKNVDKHGTRAAAEAFVAFLFSDEAQAIYAENGYRPSNPASLEKVKGNFADVGTTLTIDAVGGWAGADKAIFSDGALYDQATSAKK